MAKDTTAAKTPGAKPAAKAAAKPATKPAAKTSAAKPAAEKKPRAARRTPEQIAADKLKKTGQAAAAAPASEKSPTLSEVLPKRPQAGAMTLPADPHSAELNPALHHPSRAEMGGYTAKPALNEINPKAETEALNKLHEVETAKVLLGQSLDALRTIQVAKDVNWTAETYCAGGSRNKSLVRWARYFGVELTAMVWLNGDVKAVTKAFDLNQKNGLIFPQHAHPFHYDVYDVDQPERYAGFNGILLQPFDFADVEKKVNAFQKASGFEATLELADRLAQTQPLEEIKRGTVLRSILNPEEHIVVLEVGTKNYFNERDYGYGGRGNNQPKGDLLAVQLSFNKYDPFEPIQLTSYGSTPQYFHSTLFEPVTRLKLDASNADFDADYLGGANLVK
jgi:Uncharacterized C-terminal domain of topoisomerase IA